MNFGGRFSMYAATPSRKSSVRSRGSSCKNTWCTFWSNVSVSAARIMRLMARTASGALAAISPASSRTASWNCSSATTWLTRPSYCASSAFSVRPVNAISAAFA